MANHKSALKRAKQAKKRQEQNKTRRSEVRTYVKKLRTAVTENDKSLASQLMQQVQSLMAKLSKGSALHKKAASRKTSRLASQVAKLS